MTEKLYYWAENLENYSSDNEQDYDQVIEIKRLNFFIGKNNAGKSRFLRNLFKSLNSQTFYQSELFLKLCKIDKKLNDDIYNQTRKNPNYEYFSNTFNDLKNNLTISRRNQAVQQFSHILQYLSNLGVLNLLVSNNNAPQAKELFTNQITNTSTVNFDLEKFYIPILRGMRPVTEIENKQPYIERAQKDYFSNSQKFNSKNIITGECLYHELKTHLLGEPEQREIIKNYEEKLSQYFFNNETVSLIPKHDQDVVNIKIGSDKQFPISELGDGLQQVIILTYEAFIKKDETHAFFIEEPELHMHAGMVRQLMNFYLNETNHYYFFTTHSNHLLDMADESDQVIIQKFVKQPKENPKDGFDFKIYRCDRDRDLLASLGVKPSSVYLANCTIWVEGITDRLYITKYMEKYLVELKNSDEELYKKYRRFMPNYHYTFVEYAGSNLVHWDFSDEFTDHLNDQGMNGRIQT